MIGGMRRTLRRLGVAIALLLAAMPARAQRLVVPMDDAQTDHLKAYGLTYNAIRTGLQAEWLLNYRGGAFLLPDTPELRKRAALDGIAVEPIDGAQLASIRQEMAGGNMEAVPLEKAPRIAGYTPRDAHAWRTLSSLYGAQNDTLRAVRADAEANVAILDYPAARDRFKAAQEIIRQSKVVDHYEASIIDTRARAVDVLVKEQAAEPPLK